MATCLAFLRVPDIASTIIFYESIGFTCMGKHQEPGCDLDWALLDWEGAQFMLYPYESIVPSVNKNAGLYFHVDSIDGMIDVLNKVEANILEINEETFFGRREVVFHDINGFQITFSSEPKKKHD